MFDLPKQTEMEQELKVARANNGWIILLVIICFLQLATTVYYGYKYSQAEKSARFDRHNPELFR